MVEKSKFAADYKLFVQQMAFYEQKILRTPITIFEYTKAGEPHSMVVWSCAVLHANVAHWTTDLFLYDPDGRSPVVDEFDFE